MQGAGRALHPGDRSPAGMSSWVQSEQTADRNGALLHTRFSVTLGQWPRCSEQGNGDNDTPPGLRLGVIDPEICNRPSPEPGRWAVPARAGSLPAQTWPGRPSQGHGSTVTLLGLVSCSPASWR